MIGRQLTPLPHLTSPQNASSQNFEMTILFHAVESSGNYTFEQETPPTVFRASVISYALGAYKIFIEIFVVET